MNTTTIWIVIENKILPWMIAGGMLWFGSVRADQTTVILRDELSKERALTAEIAQQVEELRNTVELGGFVLPPTDGPALP